MYRKRKKYSEKLKQMRQAKERQRMESLAPDYPVILPELRRRITIEDFDFGHVTHVMDLHNSGRVDCYNVYADGKLWKERIGWSRILEGIRKSLPRVNACVD